MATPIEDLTRRQERVLGKYQLNASLGRAGRASRLAKRLGVMGIDDPAGTASQFGDRVLEDQALGRLSETGAIGGKRAKKLETLLDINQWGDAARTSGLDDIAGQYGAFNQGLGATIGEFNQYDPAMASIIAGGVEGRMESTSRYLSDIEKQQAQARIDYVAPILDETGALIEALRRLKDEEDMLGRSEFTRTLGQLAGAGAGFAVGGPPGAYVGSQLGGGTASLFA